MSTNYLKTLTENAPQLTLEHLPEDLKKERIFLFSRLSGRAPKAPCYLDDSGRIASKSWTDPANWMTFDDATNAAKLCGGQIGLVLSRDNDLCCIDFDGISPPENSELSADQELKAQEFFEAAIKPFVGKTYIERSHSGRGLHVLFRAREVPVSFAASIDGRTHRGVEFYAADRYLMLGSPLSANQPLGTCQDEARQALEQIADWRTKCGLPAAWKVARENARSSSIGSVLSERRLDDLAQMVEDDLAEQGIEISEFSYKRVPGEHVRFRLSTCPNCQTNDRPAIFLYESGNIHYKCFHENRCGEFGIEEFCKAVGLDHMRQPWEVNDNLLNETTPELQAEMMRKLQAEIARDEQRQKEREAQAQKLELPKIVAEYDLVTPGELVAMAARGLLDHEYLIQDLMLKGQPMVIGGTEKALKTSLTVAACVSLVSGESFLGRQVSPAKGVEGFRRLTSDETPPFPEAVRQTGKRVLLFSGESGLSSIYFLLRRITAERLIAAGFEDPEDWRISRAMLQEMGDLKICARVPKLSTPLGRAVFKELIERAKPHIVIVDPAYMAFPGDSASNMFVMGEYLGWIVETCTAIDVTPVILHHVGKIANKAKGLTLNDLAWAGWGQWAGQWMLISRQNEYTGVMHRLRLQCGNRAGDHHDLGLEVVERPEGVTGGPSTLWKASWRPWSEAKTVWSGKAEELDPDDEEAAETAQAAPLAAALTAMTVRAAEAEDEGGRLITKTMLAHWFETGSFDQGKRKAMDIPKSCRAKASEVFEAIEEGRPETAGWTLASAYDLIPGAQRTHVVALWGGEAAPSEEGQESDGQKDLTSVEDTSDEGETGLDELLG